MNEIYFTRHGQTVWNVENKICGASESDLTELGISQAKELGQRIKSEQLKIDEILYSPLRRARDTALCIAEICRIPAMAEERLREQNFGKWEATPRNGTDFQAAKRCFLNRYESGESMFMVAARIYSLLDELKEKSQKKTYLLVAHNGIARMVQSYFYDMTNEEFAAFGIKNCELRQYHF